MRPGSSVCGRWAPLVRTRPAAVRVFFGLRLHARIRFPGVIAALELAPANQPDAALAPEVTTEVGAC